jgi:hypothetical protein
MILTTISAQRLAEVWNLPAASGIMHNNAGGYCALGKLTLLNSEEFGNLRCQVNLMDEIAINNTARCHSYQEAVTVFGSWSNTYKYGLTHAPAATYGPEDPQWQRHILAFKRMLQKAIAAGYIELEDDAAAEFAAIKDKDEEVAYAACGA